MLKRLFAIHWMRHGNCHHFSTMSLFPGDYFGADVVAHVWPLFFESRMKPFF